jgi:hypothetical protein
MVRQALLFLLLATAPTAAFAADIAVVNQSGSAFTGIEVRAQGGKAWEPLSGGLGNGARRTLSGKGDNCLFDIRAKLAGDGQATWSDVNFCEAKAVTLSRRSDGTTWADYD